MDENTLRFIDLPLDTSISIANLYIQLESVREEYDYDLNYYCFKIGKENSDIAFKLYKYVIEQNNTQDWFYQIRSLLNGIYQSEMGFSKKIFFEEIENLKSINENLAYFILARIKYDSVEEIENVYNSLSNFEILEVEAIRELPVFYRNLIENEITPLNIKEQCFSQLGKVFDFGDDQLKENIFRNVYLVKGFEAEKYKLLIEYFLVYSAIYYQNLHMFFLNFSNPDYFFDLYVNVLRIFHSQQKILNTEHFYSAFSHFWKKSREQTQLRLFDLLTHDKPYLRIGAVKLIRYSHEGITQTFDLLKLDNEIKQLRALEVLLRDTYLNISDLLPLILQFKQSSYQNVVTYLQKKLGELVFESYHNYLYSLLEETIGEDFDFMRPIKEALDKYKEIKEIKGKYNDLNPLENEQDWMQLYYRLDGEKQRQMIEKASKSIPWASFAKESVVVRGNYFREEDSEIIPLSLIEHTTTIDLSMYKDSDLFDAKYAEFNFKSEF